VPAKHSSPAVGGSIRLAGDDQAEHPVGATQALVAEDFR
jgi:hypothetical protein